MQEYELKVLEQYPIEVKSTRKTRGAFFCDTDRGLLLLKEAGGFYKRVPALQKLQEYLQEQDAVKVDQFLANQEGAYVSCLEEVPYVLKQCFRNSCFVIFVYLSKVFSFYYTTSNQTHQSLDQYFALFMPRY